MFLHDPVTNTEAQPSTLTDRLCRIERVENLLGIEHAGAGIGKFDDHVASLAQRADHQYATAGGLHRVHGIADQMIENLEQLVRISANGWKHATAFEFYADIFFAQIQIAKLYGSGEYGIEIEQLLFGRYLPRKAEKVGNQIFCAPGLLANFFSQRMRPCVSGILNGQHISITKDGRERIIYFVRRAGGELAERGKFFGLYEMGLETFDVLERLPELVHETGAFLINHMLPQENQGCADEQSD